MDKNALMLRPIDNVATVVVDVLKGDNVYVNKEGEKICVSAFEDIPAYHKIALEDLKTGDKVIKYGQVIGAMTADAVKGSWISHKNIMSLPRNYEDEL